MKIEVKLQEWVGPKGDYAYPVRTISFDGEKVLDSFDFDELPEELNFDDGDLNYGDDLFEAAVSLGLAEDWHGPFMVYEPDEDKYAEYYSKRKNDPSRQKAAVPDQPEQAKASESQDQKVWVYKEFNDDCAYGEELVEVYSTKEKALTRLKSAVESYFEKPWDELLDEADDDLLYISDSDDYVSYSPDSTFYWAAEPHSVR